MTPRLFVFSICCWLSCHATPSAAEAPLVVPAVGEAFRGQWTGADAAWKLTFGDGGAAREIPGTNLALWGGFFEPAHAAQIILAGGGLIVADGVRIEKEQLRGDSRSFGKLALPLELTAGIVLRPPLDPAALDQLVARVMSSTPGADRALLDNGDELTGTILGLGDDQGPQKTLRVQAEAGPIEVPIEKLVAIIFNPTLVDKSRPSGLRALVGFRDGSRVTAVELVADKKNATLKLAGGTTLAAATDTVVALQMFGGRVTYLSDLKPASYRHIPYLQLSWPYQSDRSVLGSQLRAAGRLYAKGLGMHSPARITYDLDRAYQRFEALVAIDAEAGERGSVVFRVFTDDGSGTWQERATSETLRGGDPPAPISADLTGAKRLSLLVDYADRGVELDHADWLDARLAR